jgi:hypothetical protein
MMSDDLKSHPERAIRAGSWENPPCLHVADSGCAKCLILDVQMTSSFVTLVAILLFYIDMVALPK